MKKLMPHPKKPLPWLMDKDWTEFYRVRLENKGLTAEKVKWCKEHLHASEWGKNFGSEVFYFSTVQAATAFFIRWEGITDV